MWTEWVSHPATERLVNKLEEDISRAKDALAGSDTDWDKVNELRGRITALRGAIAWLKERAKEEGNGGSD